MKPLFNKLNETIAIAVIAVLVIVFWLNFSGSEKEYGFICPSNFTDRKEYLDSVTQWVEKYQKDHPGAELDELMKVRDGLIEKYGCGSAPQEEVVKDKLDTEKLMAGIKYAESQREDPAADSLIKTTSEKELYNNPYIKHIRTAFNGYLDGTNTGVEEGTIGKNELDNGLKCGLDNFSRDYFKSEFTVIKTEKNDYGGIVSYIAFLNNPDKVFWTWVYPYAGDDYTLRGFCEYAALIPQ